MDGVPGRELLGVDLFDQAAQHILEVGSHAWGAAVDLTLARDLDQMGDDATQFGLVTIAEYFNDAGWYWGAGYDREDSMHFEVGEALLRKWKSDGQM